MTKNVESIVVRCVLYEYFRGSNPKNRKMQDQQLKELEQEIF